MSVKEKPKKEELNNAISEEITTEVESSKEELSLENNKKDSETILENSLDSFKIENISEQVSTSDLKESETNSGSDNKKNNSQTNSNAELPKQKEINNVQNNEQEESELKQKTDENPNFKNSNNQNSEIVNSGYQVIKLFQSLVFTFITIIIIAFTIFTIANTDNSQISSGISIWGIDVSKLDKNTATEKIANYVQQSLENDLILKHNDFETNIGLEQLETKVKVSAAVDAAFEVGSGNNIFSNSFKKLSLILKPIDIKPDILINTDELKNTLNNLSTQLPDAVKQSDYYIDGNNLIITSGKSGAVVNTETMSKEIIKKINDLSYINNPIEIDTLIKDPVAPNVEQIYNEIRKEPKDAFFDSATRVVYPEENGLDFKISLDEAKNMLTVAQEEYTIPLKVLHPNVTTNMIGMEAFPELLSTFSTKYAASNVGRTTNLKLAAGKVNGTVVLPGQTFSYNAVVGERTIAAGYKEAAIYQDGQVVNGLGGGICQISTTLYNAALYANLDIVERRNHQFVPSYVGAGRDATVVYGSQDFKFKNNRNYAIKITCSVEKGIATFNIYGISEPNDCEVVISSAITSRGANSFTSATYKTLKQNGQTISSETISRDTYKTH